MCVCEKSQIFHIGELNTFYVCTAFANLEKIDGHSHTHNNNNKNNKKNNDNNNNNDNTSEYSWEKLNSNGTSE